MIGPEKLQAPYTSDGHPEKDEFQRRGFAKRVVETILAQPMGECLVVSIVGPWGSGKTTVLKYIHEEIGSRIASQGTCQIVPFNPWRFAGEEILLFELMEALVKGIDPKNSVLTEWQKLKGRISKVSSPVGKWLALPVNWLFPGFGTLFSGALDSFKAGELRKRMDGIRKQAIDHLNSSPNRIVVLLDDIDRLEADDLLLLLKSIKLVADLPNTTFVIAMDEENVCQVIGSTKGYTPEIGRKYIEKIVNVRLGLPPIPGHILSEYTLRLANEVIQRFGTKLASEDMARIRRIYSDLHAPFIRTPRTAKSVQNAFSFELGLLGPEVNAGDLLLLVCTRLLHPHLYDAIQEIIPSLDLGVGKLAERAFEDPAEKEKRQQSIWDELLKDFGRLDELRKATLRKAITHWFPQLHHLSSIEDRHDWYQERRVCSRSYFWRYFTGAILENDVRDQDVLDWISSSISNRSTAVECLKEHLEKPYSRAFLAKLDLFCIQPEESYKWVLKDLANATGELANSYAGGLSGTIKQRAAETAAKMDSRLIRSEALLGQN